MKKPAVPVVRDKACAQGPVDLHILHALEEKGLKPVKPAAKREWIRRVTYDLTGLPPKPEEVDAFLADTTVGAKEIRDSYSIRRGALLANIPYFTTMAAAIAAVDALEADAGSEGERAVKSLQEWHAPRD